ncbi:MAG: hypothetical protein ACPW61_04185 [Methyloligella sp. ZOD6]
MRITILATAALVLSAGTAMAEDPSGRPGPVLSDDQCKEVWSMTERDGDTLSQDKAEPFVLNFAMVDTNDDKSVSSDEFMKGCSKGWIQAKGDVAPVTGDTDSDAPVNPGKPEADIN